MDTTTSLITIVAAVCIGLFVMAAIVGSLYGMFVWYPEQRKKKIEAFKASGRKGEATILRLPAHISRRSARALFTFVPIGLEIRVMGMEPYEVDKVFTIPSSAVRELQVGKVVSAWVDPKEPRNLDKIVIDIQ